MPDQKQTDANTTIDPNKLDLSKNPQFAQLLSVVTQLGKGQQTLQKTLETQSTAIAGLTEAIKKGGAPDKKDEPPPSDDDVNNMSQAELAGHIFKGVRGMLDALKGDISKQLEGLSTAVETRDVKSQIEKMREEHKDFDEWVPEIKEKMSAVSGLSLAEAYVLVRQANPEKAKEMDDKYGVGLDDKKSNSSKTAFGGLLPTSRGGQIDDDEGSNRKLTAAEAAEKAWQETFGDNPALVGEDSD